MADPVPGTVSIVHVTAPHNAAADGIHFLAGDISGKSERSQRNMRFEDNRIIADDFLGRSPDRNCPGDVGGAVKILGAAVKQKDGVFGQQVVMFRCRLVMDDGGVGAAAGNGGKAVGVEQRLSLAEASQFLDDLPFAYRFAVMIKPAQKTAHGNAVMQVSLPKSH